MPPPRFDLDVTVRGDKDVLRALRDLPDNAEREVKDGSEKLARQLATIIRAAGRADSRQSARAARTVRALRRAEPLVVAGPHPMLFGSEFGIKRRTGWYAKRRYANSPARQYRRHRGNASYWFLDTYARNTDTIREAHADMVDAVIRKWSA